MDNDEVNEVRAPWRLALRDEGKLIRAYWAPAGTMEGAELVACIDAQSVKSMPIIEHQFRQLMTALAMTLATFRLDVAVTRIETEHPPPHEIGKH